MQRQISLGLVVFREDHTRPPIRKAHLYPVPDELLEDEEADFDEDDETVQIGLQVMPRVIYKQSQVAVKYLRKLMGAKVFDNPKDHEILARLIRYCTDPNDKDIVLDFFAGSASAAEAILQLNRIEDSSCRFIAIQLPEPTPEDSAARDAGYDTIADVGKERIRRVIAQMKQGEGEQLSLDLRPDEDLGFRVFKLAPSNLRSWHGVEEDTPDAYAQQMELFRDPLVGDWTVENVIYEVALKEGYGLNCHVEAVSAVTGNTIHCVTDPDKEQSFYICLDNEIGLSDLNGLNLSQDDTFVCRDVALDDEAAANLALQCRLKTI